MKFCKDCKHLKGRPMVLKFQPCLWDCGHATTQDPLTGGFHNTLCEVERNGQASHHCGPEAKFFEPVETTASECSDMNPVRLIHKIQDKMEAIGEKLKPK